ncbi:putative endoplasmic reticulum-golgi intermediate compartment protein 3 protein [Phaeoacremonium minimum UCRPA7]|uniref:Endoplasmic reticulum-Golgi intermediate compartment protein n=1 Tax=Phaeoacremonium minimum (strain UCR-PA7) TaxID=1286976 RepID=R8BRR5_PHAM7|nr:putative endoplasmic reticulum-golgi intermediate compartment protein 3 protein [Phaeoacremonium minimum UCRPA7]EOO02062.1 putative endoplasmic reticulum-golgi intermediate compartment protein 3 protein [Phaeoacremonium minimum UCRPA7]
MEIHLNITFPHIPCELLTLDVMDVSGEQQHGVQHGVNKVRLRAESEGGGVIDVKALDLHREDEAAKHLDPNYCGQCYGASPPSNAMKPGCCNTCDEVREAYAQASWAFGKGEGVEQCQREHYAERLEEQRREGCRIEGGLRVNKVVGNFHLAPGRSFSNGNMHVHDLKNYWENPNDGYSFSHTIHHLRFGPQLPESITKNMGSKALPWTNHHQNPLDGIKQVTDDPNFNYMYFVKIVPTSYLPLGWEKKNRGGYTEDGAALGSFGQGADGSVETHQYSVTSHKRSLAGGDDRAEGHEERLHSKGGIPGVFFSYDISPMKVINREERPKTFAGFLTGLCAVIGGTLTVAAAVDRGVFEGATRLKKMRSKDL